MPVFRKPMKMKVNMMDCICPSCQDFQEMTYGMNREERRSIPKSELDVFLLCHYLHIEMPYDDEDGPDT